jgi:hypothetical protein
MPLGFRGFPFPEIGSKKFFAAFLFGLEEFGFHFADCRVKPPIGELPSTKRRHMNPGRGGSIDERFPGPPAGDDCSLRRLLVDCSPAHRLTLHSYPLARFSGVGLSGIIRMLYLCLLPFLLSPVPVHPARWRISRPNSLFQLGILRARLVDDDPAQPMPVDSGWPTFREGIADIQETNGAESLHLSR